MILTKPRQSVQDWRGFSLAEAPWRGIQRSPDGSPLEHGRVLEARYCDRTNRLVAKVESQANFCWGHVVSGTSFGCCANGHPRSLWIESGPSTSSQAQIASIGWRIMRKELFPVKTP